MIIDFRSDTVTRPSKGMLDAMFQAAVGDDVFGEDPSINLLQKKAAAMFEMEDALFCPSGTMTNQIAIKCHTQPGDEVICDSTSHIYQYEGGGIAFNSGCSVKLLEGNRGRITAEKVLQGINPNDIHKAPSTLVSLENTSNRGGGSCYDMEEIINIRQVCDDHNIKLHLDGARLFNALVSKKQSPSQFGHVFHSISICLSKSLGCPVGSLLLGNKEFIAKARRYRKVFGGGMRQAGYLATAGIYALDNNIDRLQEDHVHASQIAAALANKSFVQEVYPVETNIIIFSLKEPGSANDMVKRFKESQILIHAISHNQVRLVTHLDITPELTRQTIAFIESL